MTVRAAHALLIELMAENLLDHVSRSVLTGRLGPSRCLRLIQLVEEVGASLQHAQVERLIALRESVHAAGPIEFARCIDLLVELCRSVLLVAAIRPLHVLLRWQGLVPHRESALQLLYNVLRSAVRILRRRVASVRRLHDALELIAHRALTL